MSAIPRAERLIVALDVPSAAEARALVEKLGDTVRFYKIGLELFSAQGYFELSGWLADRGWVAVSAERPMHRHPLHAPLLAAFAAFDMARAPFMKTAQMFVLLRKAQ